MVSIAVSGVRRPESGLHPHDPRTGAFTLIELLVVIGVIALLAGMLLAVIPLVRKSTMRARTSSIMAVVTQALQASSAQHARGLSAAEHPLAGSIAPRPRFLRSGGVALATDGDAYRTGNPFWVDASLAPYLLQDEDLHADASLPLLFGMPRGRLRILGAAAQYCSRWYQLPDPGTGKTWPTAATPFPNPEHLRDFTLKVWLNQGFARAADSAPDAWEKAGDRLFEMALGDAGAELIQLGGLRRPVVERDPLLLNDRVRVDNSAAGAWSDTWEPGRVQGSDGRWARYALRGPYACDSWGHEILLSIGGNGGLRLESAGPDGVFRWLPGDDGVLQTAPDAAVPAGDDHDGCADNLRIE